MHRAVSATIAGALNFLNPGMGHLYLGRARRFFLPLSGFALVVLGLSQTGTIATLPGFALLAALLVALCLFGIIDGVVLGARSGRDASRWYSRWFVLLGWLASIYVLAFYWDDVRDWLGYGVYRMPSAYMRPTLTPGDIILANSHVSPSRDLVPNALVVFRHPNSGVHYVLRIKDQTSPETYSMSSGLPFAPSIDGIPRENITGVVTALLWSPERKEFARKLK